MKKYLVLIGAAILVMALASPSLAQWKSWGHMEIQTIWEKKPDFNTGRTWANGVSLPPDSDTTWRHVAERFRFYLQYGDPKTVRAVIGFEADSTEWGESRSSGTVTGGRMGGYTADSVQMEIKHAYLDWIIPNTPVQVTAGLQAFAYGGRLFWNNDSMGVKVRTDFAPHSVELFWGRLSDQGIGTNSARQMYGVADLYGASYDIKQKAWDMNVYFAYLNDLFSGWQATTTNPITGDPVAINNKYDDHPWWLGVQGGFRPGNWTLYGHFLYVGGKREFRTTPSVGDQSYKAYMLEASAKYRIGPGMFVGGEFFYATGNDGDSQDDIKYAPLGRDSEARSIFGNDRTVFFWMNASQMGYYHNRQLDFQGMWYGRLNFEYSPTTWVRFNANYLYIGDTSSGQGGATIVNKITGLSGPRIVNSPRGSQQATDEDTVGQEINLITTLNIYQGFQWNIGLAVFLPGKVYEGPNESADSAYALNTKLVYAF